MANPSVSREELQPFRLLAAFGVPLLLAMLAWSYGGWSGSVPGVGILSALGISAILVPHRGPWRWLAEASEDGGGPLVGTWLRVLPRIGVVLLAFAVGVVWLLAA